MLHNEIDSYFSPVYDHWLSILQQDLPSIRHCNGQDDHLLIVVVFLKDDWYDITNDVSKCS